MFIFAFGNSSKRFLKQQVMCKKETYFVIDGVRYDLVKDSSNVRAALICESCALRCLCELLNDDTLCSLFSYDYHFEKHNNK